MHDVRKMTREFILKTFLNTNSGKMLAKRTKLQPLHRRTDSFKKARKLTHKLFFDKRRLVCHSSIHVGHVPHPPFFYLNAKFQLYSMRQ